MSDMDCTAAIERAQAALGRRDHVLAVEACEDALAIAPQSCEALFILALVSATSGDPFRALDLLRHAHDAHPDNREVVLMMAAQSAGLGRLADAAYFAKLSMTLAENAALAALLPPQFRDPASVMAHVGAPRFLTEASIQFELRHYPAALFQAELAVRNQPDSPAPYAIMGKCLLALGHWDRAIAAFRAAVHLAPDDASHRADLAEALIGRGDFADGRALLEAAADASPDDDDIASRLVDLARFDPQVSADRLRRDTARWNRRLPRSEHRGEPAGGAGPKRVGFLINQAAVDLWMQAIEPVMMELHRRKVEIHVLQQYMHDETATLRLRRYSASWREIYNVDDETLAFMLEQVDLKVLVDLCGFTPNNRRAVLARKIVPYQLGWLTSGAETADGAHDYILADEIAAGVFEGERLIVLQGGAHSYVPKAPATPADLPARAGGGITFGGVATPATVLPSVPLWAKVLHAVPGSTLVLGNMANIDEPAVHRFMEAFANWGLSDRVLCQRAEGKNPTADFLSAVDVMLDSVVVNGGRDTCDALREGIPVVSLLGANTDSIRGAAILASAGHGEWIARSPDEFVAIAKGLATDVDGLEAVRNRLREDIPTSALCDPATLAAAMDAVFEGLGK